MFVLDLTGLESFNEFFIFNLMLIDISLKDPVGSVSNSK